jgi:hypothetical protein
MPHGGAIEDRVMIGKRPTERDPVARKSPIESVPHRFQLHVIAEHPLSGVIVVHGRGQEGQQSDIGERPPQIAAEGEMSHEGGKPTPREAIAGVVEDAHCPITGHGYRRDGRLHLAGYKHLGPDDHIIAARHDDSADGEAVVAGGGVTIPIDIEQVASIGIHRCMEHTSK